MSIARPLRLAAAGVLLVVLGFGAGIAVGPRVEGLWVTQRFVSDRMAECALTLRLHEEAVAAGNDAMQRLVSGDLRQCRLLVSMHPAKISERDLDTAARITATSPDPIATR